MKNSKGKPQSGMSSKDALHKTTGAGVEDPRFAHIRQDPLFRRVPKDKKRVNIDSRFGAMFHDDKFKLKYKVDKRGKPINLTTDENLKRYYNLVDDEAENENNKSEENEAVVVPSGEIGLDQKYSEELQENEVPESESSILPENTKKKLQDLTVDYARGEGVLNSDSDEESDNSSSDEDSSSSADEDEGIADAFHAWGVVGHDAEQNNEEVQATHRLALCNMDWDRIKSDDLMVLFNSFLPPGGTLKHVTIYPSEYGKERLAEEEIYGPRELREEAEVNLEDAEPDDDNDDGDSNEPQSEVESGEDDECSDEMSTGFHVDEGDEGSSFHMERLRKYQLNRLRYFYAVLDFDSSETANKIYTECQGLEFESSSTKVDLSFIPDDLTFDEEPRDKCDKMPTMDKYAPKFFTTKALQQLKVDLTWDETDPQRQQLTQRIHDPKEKVDDEDLRAYLASSSDEDEEAGVKQGDEENVDSDAESNVDAISKYRNLLESIQDDEKKKTSKDVEMEITWGVGLKKTTESLVKKKLVEEKVKKMTPWEEMLAKKQEKKKTKKKLDKHKDNDDGEEDSDSNEDETEQKEENADLDQPFSDDDVDVDLNDPFFKDLHPDSKSEKKSKSKKDNLKEKKSIQKNEDTAALELLLMEDDTNEKKSHFSLKKILESEQNESTKKLKKKNKRNKKKNKNAEEQDATKASENQDTFQIDLKDDRFSSLYTSHKFNVDPSDPNYKNTKAMGAIISEKQKRRLAKPVISEASEDQSTGGPVSDNVKEIGEKETEEVEPVSKVSRKSELASLVKSIKRNTEHLKQKKNKFATGQKKKIF